MDKWMFNVHESISSPCHFQGDTLLDDDGCLHSIYEKIMSVLSSSGSDGKLSTVYHYHFAAIQYGAIIVAGNFLLAEEAETLLDFNDGHFFETMGWSFFFPRHHCHQWFFNGFTSPGPSPLNVFLLINH